MTRLILFEGVSFIYYLLASLYSLLSLCIGSIDLLLLVSTAIQLLQTFSKNLGELIVPNFLSSATLKGGLGLASFGIAVGGKGI